MRLQTIRRALVGLANASVFLFMALPFAAISQLYGTEVFAMWAPATLMAGAPNRVIFRAADVPSIIRGGEVGGSGPVLFEPQVEEDLPLAPRTDAGGERRLLAPELDFTWGGNTVSTVVWVHHPGCYAYQYDGAAGSRVVVVSAT